jgi:DNA-binding CsgD family transcriptional regulator
MPKTVRDISLADVHGELRIISRLLAAQLRATTGQQEMIRILSSTGVSNAEVADILDTTPGTVATTLQRLKKKAQAKEAVGVSETSTEPGDRFTAP